MPRPRPFTFDYSFDNGADDRRKAEEIAKRRAAAEAEANRPPTFSVEEMEQARAEAHALGRQEGMADAMAGIEQQVGRTLDILFSRLPKVFEQHAAWTRTMEADAARLSMALMRKLAPQLSRDRELQEVERVIREAFGFLTEQPKVMVRVAPALEEALRDKVTLMASRVGYEGQVVLVGDPELPTDDCRISWQAGAVERSLDETWDQIDQIVERALSGQPVRERGERLDAATVPAADEAVPNADDAEIPDPDDSAAGDDAEQPS
ncbi:FliH/SctL family protein [Thalassobaculum sp.]|uniref:FliH/SctL family protein n=1 Tax=Thalassobaculum sp. TaxID=2022740 RepID=UPI0032F09101